MSTYLKSLQNATEEYTKIKTELTEKTKTLLTEAFKEFFTEVPEVKAINWLQFTPWFNDGEVCEFSRHSANIILSESDDSEEYLDDDGLDSDYFTDINDLRSYVNRSNYIPPEIKDLIKNMSNEKLTKIIEVVDAIDSIDERMYLEFFGDHVKVIVTKNGIDVEEYEHE